MHGALYEAWSDACSEARSEAQSRNYKLLFQYINIPYKNALIYKLIMISNLGGKRNAAKKLIASEQTQQIKEILALQLLPSQLNELMIFAIYSCNTEAIDELIKQNAKLDNPPQSLTIYTNEDNDALKLLHNYKEAPYIIHATVSGCIPTIKCLVSHQRKLTEVGHIGYSPKQHDSIISNCLGAAAFYGHKDVVDWISTSSPCEFLELINCATTEALSIEKPSKLNRECNGYTPLQLCIVGADDISLFAELLTNSQGKFNCTDSEGNTLIHLCILYDKPNYLVYLINNYVRKDLMSMSDRNLAVCNLYRDALF
jgi:hypothetical protein